PAAAANGLLVARARVDPAEVMWLHAAPEVVAVVVREGEEAVLSRADDLKREGRYLPMTRLERAGQTIRREDRWPTESDLGALVLLPGGEVGTLTAWWNAEDGSEWRWQIELYNHV
ncbi:MAG: hypothetical protein ABR573_00005, partial [Candidatus Dormibacteria bacterium]